MRVAPALLVLLAAPALAQVQVPPAADPGAIQQREIERERREREDELRRRRIEAPLERPAAPRPAAPEPDTGVRLTVREIRFTPSEILPREALEALARPLLGRSVGLSELNALVDAVNALYRERGVLTARAVLEPQDVATGVVQVRLIEGRIGRYDIRGAQTTDPGYVSDRMRQPPGALLRLDALEQDLIRFNRTNDAQLRAELRPGARFGETDVVLQLAEPPRHSWRLAVDNLGAEATGEARAAATYRNASLFGRRDDFSATLTASEGHTGAYLSYGIPINRLGGRLIGGYYDDRTRIVNGPLEPLRITGSSTAAVLTLRQPVRVAATHQLDGLVSYKRRESETLIDSNLLSASELEDWSVGGELQLEDARGAWSATLHYSWGSNDLVGAASSDYSVWRASVRRTQRLPEGMTLQVSFSGQQSSDDLLPASEQFLLGGEGSVRGYPVGVFAGDRGYQIGAELHRVLPAWIAEGRASGFAFVDYGQVWPFRAPNAPGGSERLAGAGVGVQFAYGRGITGRVTLAVPLRRVPNEDHGARLTFQAAAAF